MGTKYLIKILFIPLTHKSMKSMKRMQELQPHIKKLKEKYENDKQAMNQATMELFKEHKVNPLGGCWPMLLPVRLPPVAGWIRCWRFTRMTAWI